MDVSGIVARWEGVKKSLPGGVKLVAVSKKAPEEAIKELYRAGQRAFGENRVQELVEKHAALPGDIEWHMIGHLQTNKVKLVAPFVSLIHGVDSARLLEVIDREGERNGRVIPCLLQFHVAMEESKHGLNLEEARALLESARYAGTRYARVAGVMGMASFTRDAGRVRGEFARLRELFEVLKRDYFAGDEGFRELSMGMSGDYLLAVEAGSTLVRVGSALFWPEREMYLLK
ncbi:MAG: YggS family pyridoxal phosphate-dependent enzyme [Odoribacteraceae bacterium]|jgi:pyridoxal phosphate enzyme (YggS family)|nr:YggS family pyridoxal phosphate-dependent enzyme [Odoribacteraceae bacterium]